VSVGPARRPSRDRGVKRDDLHRVFLFRPALSASRFSSGSMGESSRPNSRVRGESAGLPTDFFFFGAAANGLHNP
jgi:hypothetical protein